MDTEKIKKLTLRQGVSIPSETVERILGYTREKNPDRYGFDCQTLAKVLETRIREEGDFDPWIVGDKYGLRILTENEKVEYRTREEDAIFRRECKRKRQLAGCNSAEMTPWHAEQLEVLRKRNNAIVATMKKARREFPSPAVKEETTKPIRSIKDRYKDVG